jgi:hypothetical protein
LEAVDAEVGGASKVVEAVDADVDGTLEGTVAVDVEADGAGEGSDAAAVDWGAGWCVGEVWASVGGETGGDKLCAPLGDLTVAPLGDLIAFFCGWRGGII